MKGRLAIFQVMPESSRKSHIMPNKNLIIRNRPSKLLIPTVGGSGVIVCCSSIAWSQRDQMFIATP